MKKLIIAAAIVCAAAMSQAASMKWMCYNEGDVGLITLGSAVYICTAGAAGFESAADIQNYLFGTAGNVGTLEEDMTFGGTFALDTVRGIDDSEAGMKSFTIVVVNNGGTGYWTVETQGEVYTTATEPYMAEVALDTVMAEAATPFSTGPTPVPEPTSGLMLILGMAGLALKRKRA